MNVTTGVYNNSPGRDVSYTGPLYTTIVVMCLIQSAVACLGNLLTVVIIWRTPSLHTVTNRYILSLAVADFLAGILALFSTLWYIDADLENFLSACKYCCLFYYVFLFGTFEASMSNMTMIALDRLVFIVYPFVYERYATGANANSLISLSWCVTIAFSVLPLKLNRFDDVGTCLQLEVLSKEYQVVGVGTVLVSSLAAVTASYASILVVAKKQRAAISARVNNNYSANHVANRRQISVFVLICVISFVCWVPYYTCMIMGVTVGVSYDVFNFCAVLGLVNSAINFILYSYMNKDFRKSFSTQMCRCRKR
ncbi:histamine H2 receptor-like [Gigantopelta aegis]|uniref:histamine H2 receptor-like n=1 Tax=Gigantopelta aegis TaxID=1735272 RepID=UPI001B88C315|nr:histamine H2 receptor-like [Gigantopelta aegis]